MSSYELEWKRFQILPWELMDRNEYLHKCVIPILNSFILKHHSPKDIVFWHDIAACLYSKTITDNLNNKFITFITRGENASNFSQSRLIERFWEIYKRYEKHLRTLKGLTRFMVIWKIITHEVPNVHGKLLIAWLGQKIMVLAKKGVRKAMADWKLAAIEHICNCKSFEIKPSVYFWKTVVRWQI